MEEKNSIQWEQRYRELLVRLEASSQWEQRYRELLVRLEASSQWEQRYLEVLVRLELMETANQKLSAENEKLSADNEKLREKLNTNSKNSSKPPSQDPFRKKNSLEKSDRKPGGQPGHLGHNRARLPLDKVTRVVDLFPPSCPRCRDVETDLQSVSIESRQVIDLPEITPDVTQYNIHTCRCAGCGKNVKADLPIEASKGFGPRLMSLVTLLAGEGLMSKRKIRSIIGQLGIKMSLGSISDIHQLAAQLLQASFEEIKDVALSQKNLNVDETGWFLRSKRCWIWTGSSEKATFFQIDSNRSQAAFSRIFGSFDQTLTTDRYGAYNGYPGKRQLCLAHISRDFIKISQRSLPDGAIGRILVQELSEVFSWWQKFKAEEINRSELQEKTQYLVCNIERALMVGAGSEQISPRSQSLCLNILRNFNGLWTFLKEEGVEPTNNQAERAIRPFVITRKLSNGSQSEWGLRFSERIRSLAHSLPQSSSKFFDFLKRLFYFRLGHGTAPSVFA